MSEASSNLSRYDGIKYGLRHNKGEGLQYEQSIAQSRSTGFGVEVKRRIIIGTHSLSASNYESYYLQATNIRKEVKKEFDRAFHKQHVHVLLTPTSYSTAPLIKKQENQDPVLDYLNDVFTVPASLAGLPAMNVPVGLSLKGLPIGLQLISGRFMEPFMFHVGKAIEKTSKTK